MLPDCLLKPSARSTRNLSKPARNLSKPRFVIDNAVLGTHLSAQSRLTGWQNILEYQLKVILGKKILGEKIRSWKWPLLVKNFGLKNMYVLELQEQNYPAFLFSNLGRLSITDNIALMGHPQRLGLILHLIDNLTLSLVSCNWLRY